MPSELTYCARALQEKATMSVVRGAGRFAARLSSVARQTGHNEVGDVNPKHGSFPLLLTPVLVRYRASFAFYAAPKGHHTTLQANAGIRSTRLFSTGATGAAEVSSCKHNMQSVLMGCKCGRAETVLNRKHSFGAGTYKRSIRSAS